MNGQGATAERGWIGAALATLVVFAIVAGLTIFRTVPLITADEIGYLGIARYLATGSAPDMVGSTYYYPGYALLLWPFQMLLGDPRLVYRSAMLLNAVAMAGTVPLLLRIASELGFERDHRLPLLAALVALWPTHFVLAFLALPEVWLRGGFLVLVLLALQLLRRPNWQACLGLALCAGLLYLFHPRMLVVLSLVAVLLAVLAIRRSVDWRAAVGGLALMAGLWLAVGALNGLLQGALWHGSPSTLDVVTGLVGDVFGSLHGLSAAAFRALGHGWYQIVASLLLVPLGVLYWVRTPLKGAGAGRLLVLGLVLLTAAGVGTAGVASMIKVKSLDWVVYGRYLDAVTPVLLWAGLLAVTRVDLRARLWRGMLLFAFLAVAIGAMIYWNYATRDVGPANQVNIGGLMAFFRIADWREPGLLFLFCSAACATLGIALFVSARWRWLPVLLLALYVGISDWSLQQWMAGTNIVLEQRFAQAAEAYARAGGETIRLDRSAPIGQSLLDQYVLDLAPFVRVDLSHEPLPPGTPVVIGIANPPAGRFTCLAPLREGTALVRVADQPSTGGDIKALASPNEIADCR